LDKGSEKATNIRRIEPYLTFLYTPQLERQGANIESKIEELEQLNETCIFFFSIILQQEGQTRNIS